MYINIEGYIRDIPRRSITLATGDIIDDLFTKYEIASIKKLKRMVLLESNTHELLLLDNILLLKDDQHSRLLLDLFGSRGDYQYNNKRTRVHLQCCCFYSVQ